MKNSDFRKVMAQIFTDYNAYFGDNTGTFNEHDYKINYQIINNTLAENQRTFILDIDIWSKSTTKADDIADDIEDILNYKSKGSWATFILENRYNQDEKDIYRRTLSYEVRTY